MFRYLGKKRSAAIVVMVSFLFLWFGIDLLASLVAKAL